LPAELRDCHRDAYRRAAIHIAFAIDPVRNASGHAFIPANSNDPALTITISQATELAWI
jgi:hypothetical protein